LPSFMARALNAALRSLVKRRLRNGLSVDAVRAAGAVLDRWVARGEMTRPGDSVVAGEVSCEWFASPAADEQRILLYLHGGGFITHLPSAYRVFARRLGAALGAQVLLPHYRLAPEHPFPAGIDDCLVAYRWLLAQGFNPRRIVIAGDSAGGNLALVTAIRIRDEALPAPGCVVMLSPATDLTGGSASLDYNRDRDPLLVPEALPLVLSTYAPAADARHPWISPIHDSLEHMPPLLFHAGSTELLVDDSIRAADKARWAGTVVELTVWPDMPHVFQMMNALPEARAAIDRIARFVRQYVPAAQPAATRPPAGALELQH
jgi:epsilon-lactone hydrolase